MNHVPFLDLSREFENLGDEMLDAARRVLEDGRFILDEHAEAFENEFADYVGLSYGIGVNSGSDALYLSLRALDVGPGHEVIVPSHTFISTVDAVVRVGATPVFVDIDAETYTIDPERIEEAITPVTRAVIAVHLYGQPAQMNLIQTIAGDRDIAVIEDASQAHGAKYRGTPVGSLGDVACFSLYPTKNLGAYGDGGIVITDNDRLANRLEKLRQYGSNERYHYEFVGVNSRLDELQAAMLRQKLKYLDQFNTRRRKIAEKYDEELENIETPAEHADAEHVYHLYVVRTSKRDDLQNHLDNRGIGTLIHYPTPIHEQEAYVNIGRRESVELTETIADEILSLPMYPWLRSEEVEQIIDAVNSF